MCFSVLTKECNKCFQIKSIFEFHKHSQGKYGKRPDCSNCSTQRSKKYYDNNIKNNRTEEFNNKSKENQRKYRKVSKHKYLAVAQKWRDNNRHIIKSQNANPEVKAKKRTWYLKNKQKVAESSARIRANKRKATPKWVKKNDLLNIYVNCPVGYEVDHILPLTNKNVCGLHVPWNLQYLSEYENGLKLNKFDFTYENKSWQKLLG